MLRFPKVENVSPFAKTPLEIHKKFSKYLTPEFSYTEVVMTEEQFNQFFSKSNPLYAIEQEPIKTTRLRSLPNNCCRVEVPIWIVTIKYIDRGLVDDVPFINPTNSSK